MDDKKSAEIPDGNIAKPTETSSEQERDTMTQLDAITQLDERIASQRRTLSGTFITDKEREEKQRVRRSKSLASNVQKRSSSKVLHNNFKPEHSVGATNHQILKRKASVHEYQLKPAPPTFYGSTSIQPASIDASLELVDFTKKPVQTRQESLVTNRHYKGPITNMRQFYDKIEFETGISSDNDHHKHGRETEKATPSSPSRLHLPSASLPGITFSRELDARIAYKTGIPIEPEEEQQQPQMRSQESVYDRDIDFDPQEQASASNCASRRRTTSSRPGITNSRELDELIAYKTGIPLDQENEQQQEQDASPTLPGARHVARAASIQPRKQDTRANFKSEDPEQMYLDDDEKAKQDDIEAGIENDDIAVAVEIKEDAEDSYIPSAVQYDPEAKPPIYKNRRFYIYGAMVSAILLVVILTVVGISLAKRNSSKAIDSTDTIPPPQTASQSIISQLELVVGKEKLSNPESAHYLAMKWITEDDPLQVGPTALNLVQRFLLAVFYFETNKSGEWLSCNAPSPAEPEETCLFQQLIDVNPHKYRSLPSYKWLSGEHECNWAGIKCNSFDVVIDITLKAQQLTGTLPVDLAKLTYLEQLSLSWNDFTGSIPEELSKLSHLLHLELHFNHLTGTIPDLKDVKRLQVLNVAENHLSGSIPVHMADMIGLKALYLFENMFTGSLPEAFGDLNLLNYIRLNNNFFTGTIPSSLGALSPLELWLGRNPISGSIPPELGSMDGLKGLRLNRMNLNGTIPNELFNLTNLVYLDLSKAGLTGTLSTQVANLENLASFVVNGNELSGEIPVSMGDMELEVMLMFSNDFSGQVPQSVCNRKGPTGLQQLAVDCLPSSNGTVRVFCDCCDICCDHETGVCHSVTN